MRNIPGLIRFPESFCQGGNASPRTVCSQASRRPHLTISHPRRDSPWCDVQFKSHLLFVPVCFVNDDFVTASLHLVQMLTHSRSDGDFPIYQGKPEVSPRGRWFVTCAKGRVIIDVGYQGKREQEMGYFYLYGLMCFALVCCGSLGDWFLLFLRSSKCVYYVCVMDTNLFFFDKNNTLFQFHDLMQYETIITKQFPDVKRKIKKCTFA